MDVVIRDDFPEGKKQKLDRKRYQIGQNKSWALLPKF
jgi:hypothetical protein